MSGSPRDVGTVVSVLVSKSLSRKVPLTEYPSLRTVTPTPAPTPGPGLQSVVRPPMTKIDLRGRPLSLDQTLFVPSTSSKKTSQGQHHHRRESSSTQGARSSPRVRLGLTRKQKRRSRLVLDGTDRGRGSTDGWSTWSILPDPTPPLTYDGDMSPTLTSPLLSSKE